MCVHEQVCVCVCMSKCVYVCVRVLVHARVHVRVFADLQEMSSSVAVNAVYVYLCSHMHIVSVRSW